jgi:hypothetical protein
MCALGAYLGWSLLSGGKKNGQEGRRQDKTGQ